MPASVGGVFSVLGSVSLLKLGLEIGAKPNDQPSRRKTSRGPSTETVFSTAVAFTIAKRLVKDWEVDMARIIVDVLDRIQDFGGKFNIVRARWTATGE